LLAVLVVTLEGFKLIELEQAVKSARELVVVRQEIIQWIGCIISFCDGSLIFFMQGFDTKHQLNQTIGKERCEIKTVNIPGSYTSITSPLV